MVVKVPLRGLKIVRSRGNGTSITARLVMPLFAASTGAGTT